MDWENLIPYIHPEESRNIADAFLAAHNREGVLPLPIETIVEFELGINIVPIPGLQDRIGTVGFITSDLTEIDIDLDVAERFSSRFRWTIAHEVGHVLLHRPLYEAQSFATPDEWKRWVAAIPDRLYRNLEIQANIIAAQILMPLPALTRCFEETIGRAAARGLDWRAGPDTIYRQMAKKFEVAPDSIKYALRNEGLAEGRRPNSTAGCSRSQVLLEVDLPSYIRSVNITVVSGELAARSASG